MIYRPCVFIVWKVRYILACVLGVICLAVGKSQHLQGYFLVPISRKSHMDLNICPSTVMWQGRKFSHCENIKNDSYPMSFCCLEEYIRPKYVFRSIIFAQNGKKSLRNINFSLKTTGNKAQAIKLMMSALNITIWYVRPTKIFDNMTITLCFKQNLRYLKNGDLPSGIFWWNYIFDIHI